MTTSKTEKLIIIAVLLFFLAAGAAAEEIKQTRGSEIQVTAGIVPVYHFSIQPEGMDYKEYFFTGSSIQGLYSYRTGRITARFGLTWNLLFRVASDNPDVINILSPALSIHYHFKKYFYAGMGLSGVMVPGKVKLDGNTYKTTFDLWYSLFAGYRIQVSYNLAVLIELNYSLNVTCQQWSSGVDNTQTRFPAETRLAHMLTLHSGVSFPVKW